MIEKICKINLGCNLPAFSSSVCMKDKSQKKIFDYTVVWDKTKRSQQETVADPLGL